MAAVLCGGGSALASHRSAAALWELDGIDERAVEISLKAGRRIRGAVVHRRRSDDDPRTVRRQGIPTTGIDRTLLDLASVVSPRRAGVALDAALHAGSTTLDSIRQMLSAARGRPGARALRGLVDLRDVRDHDLESHLESALLRVLRRAGLPLPIPQYDVIHRGAIVARLDFAYPTHRLGIEADGFRWHGGRERWAQDLRRENRLKLLGWTLLRFSWDDVREQPENVAAQISAALHLVGVSQLPTISVVN